MNTVEIVTSDTAFSVVCNGEEILVVAPTEAGISMSVIEEERVELVDFDDLPKEGMDLQVRGIHRVSSLGSHRPGRAPSYNASAVDHSDEAEIQQCIDLILESFDNNPDQTKAEISAETRRIAKEVYGSEDEKYRVAGVRAAITRGAYDVTLPNPKAKKIRGKKAGHKVGA